MGLIPLTTAPRGFCPFKQANYLRIAAADIGIRSSAGRLWEIFPRESTWCAGEMCMQLKILLAHRNCTAFLECLRNRASREERRVLPPAPPRRHVVSDSGDGHHVPVWCVA